MGFEKGHKKAGGRQKGTPNKATLEIRDVAKRLVEDADYRKNLRARLIAGDAGQVEVLLWYYAYGKPKETLEIDSPQIEFHMCLGGRDGRHETCCKRHDKSERG